MENDAEVAATTKSAEERAWEQLRHNAEAIALYTSADDGEMPPAAWAPAPLARCPRRRCARSAARTVEVLKQEEGCVEAFRTALTLELPASALAAEGAEGDDGRPRPATGRAGSREGLLRADARVARREGRRQGRGGGGGGADRRWRSRTPTATRSSSSAPTGLDYFVNGTLKVEQLTSLVQRGGTLPRRTQCRSWGSARVTTPSSFDDAMAAIALYEAASGKKSDEATLQSRIWKWG